MFTTESIEELDRLDTVESEVSEEETIDIAQLEHVTIRARIVGTRSRGMLKLLFLGRNGETLFSTACHYCQIQASESVRAVEFPVQAATPKDLARAIYTALEAQSQSHKQKARAAEELER